MKHVLYLDPAIRDYIFIPLIVIMVIVSLLRMNLTQLLNAKDSPLLKSVNLSRFTLKGTIF